MLWTCNGRVLAQWVAIIDGLQVHGFMHAGLRAVRTMFRNRSFSASLWEPCQVGMSCSVRPPSTRPCTWWQQQVALPYQHSL